MTWGAVAVAGASLVGGHLASESAKDASRRAAEVQAQGQEAGLEYLKEREALPIFYRDQALGALGAEYGLAPFMPDGQKFGKNLAPGEMGGSPTVVDLAKRTPLYDAILSTRGAGEEAIARSASVTGRARGGATIADLADYNTRLENQALLSSYENVMRGLSGLAGAQGYAPQIAQQSSNIGATLAGGELSAGRAAQQGYAGMAQALGSGLGAYLGRPMQSAEGAPINPIGATINPVDYSRTV